MILLIWDTRLIIGNMILDLPKVELSESTIAIEEPEVILASEFSIDAR